MRLQSDAQRARTRAANRDLIETPLTAADLLNDRVIPFFDEQDVKLQRVLTDRGSADLRRFLTEIHG